METEEYYGGTYPSPKEEKDKHIKTTVVIAFDLEYDIPESWTREQIIEDIKENLDDFTWYNERIEDIDL